MEIGAQEVFVWNMIGATILTPAIVLSPQEGRDELSSQKFQERGLFQPWQH